MRARQPSSGTTTRMADVSDEFDTPFFTALRDADPRLANLGRSLFRLERIEADIAALKARYQRRRTDRISGKSYVDYSTVEQDLQEILDGKP